MIVLTDGVSLASCYASQHVKILQKEVISTPCTQKQPGCKIKDVALFKMASVKKVVKSKGAAKKWL